MAAPTPSDLDFSQCIQGAYDDANGRIRVDAAITAPIDVDGEVLVDIRAEDGDSVKIAGTSDGTSTGTIHYVKVNNDGSINTRGVQLFTLPFDAITATYPTATQEVYVSRVGGIAGTVQQTATVNYTDSTKAVFLNVAVV